MFCNDEEFNSLQDTQIISSSLTNGNLNPFKDYYDKIICFDPVKIEEINYTPGAHVASPRGKIIFSGDTAMLLHYKFIGMDYLIDRYTKMGNRLSKQNLTAGHGIRYKNNAEETIIPQYKKYANQSIFRNMYLNPEILQYKYKNKQCVIDTYGNIDEISKRIINGEIWEPMVARWIELHSNENTTYLDIGCNIGTHICVANLSGVGEVFGFECDKNTYPKVINTIKINGWSNTKIFNVAASDKKKENLNFIKVVGNIGGSYIQETHIGWEGATEKSLNINSDTIDNILPISKINPNNKIIVKIDVEGHEFEALKGMTEILDSNRTKQIIIELNPYTSEVNKIMSIIEYIQSKNYNKLKMLFRCDKDSWSGTDVTNIDYIDTDYNEIKKLLSQKIIIEIVALKL